MRWDLRAGWLTLEGTLVLSTFVGTLDGTFDGTFVRFTLDGTFNGTFNGTFKGALDWDGALAVGCLLGRP